MASEFIVSTCQLLSTCKSYYSVSECMQDRFAESDPPSTGYLVYCGSFMEFYIQPLNSCIDDVDYISCGTDALVFSEESPVLPSDVSGLSETITCYKIVPYHKYPGFVRLHTFGELNYNWYYMRYEHNYWPTSLETKYLAVNMTALTSTDSDFYRSVLNINKFPGFVCGPAIKSQYYCDTSLGTDKVIGIYCPNWPQEAHNWPIRPRKYGWPTLETISRVVQNGCHVVYAQHRDRREDEEQWRLSFSFGELILLQSWTPVQQIVYHLLRFFAKQELIQSDCPKENEVLCTYHLKTLVLWTCEEMSPEWWNSNSVIEICRKLLQKLHKWLKMGCYSNYFIPEANLFHKPSCLAVLHNIVRQLIEFSNPGILSQWFVINYIEPITQTQFVFGKNVVKPFLDCLLPLLGYRKRNELKSLAFLLFIRLRKSSENCRCSIKYRFSSGLRWSSNFERIGGFHPKREARVTSLSTVEKDLCLKHFDLLIYILHAAYGLCFGECSWHDAVFVEFVIAISKQPTIIRSQYHNVPKTYAQRSGRFQFLRAQNLMKNLTGSNTRSEFRLVSLMSKAFLIKSLECDDSQFTSIAPVALAYLAALHFATSEYQKAIHYALEVLADWSIQKQQETLNAGCLLFIDDVARIVGLYLLNRAVAYNNLVYIDRLLYLDLRLTPQVLAHYLAVTSAERISTHLDRRGDLSGSEFPMDKYLKVLCNPRCIAGTKSRIPCNVYSRASAISDEAAIDLLMERALEMLTSFYSVISKDFGIKCNTAECYRALYFYKYHQYDIVMRLCKHVICEPAQPDKKNNSKEFEFTNVLLLPPLDSFFDKGIQSLLGCHVLQSYLSPLNDETRKLGPTGPINLNYQRWFDNNGNFLKYELSVVVPNCYITCNYFIGRQFLARYLKVRCCIDCHLPYAEALTDFAAEKADRPFEQVIRRFLLQKLGFYKK